MMNSCCELQKVVWYSGVTKSSVKFKSSNSDFPHVLTDRTSALQTLYKQTRNTHTSYTTTLHQRETIGHHTYVLLNNSVLSTQFIYLPVYALCTYAQQNCHFAFSRLHPAFRGGRQRERYPVKPQPQVVWEWRGKSFITPPPSSSKTCLELLPCLLGTW